MTCRVCGVNFKLYQRCVFGDVVCNPCYHWALRVLHHLGYFDPHIW